MKIYPECSEDFYGRDCNKPCGHCRGNAPCDSATGHCSSGCQNYWTGDRCEGTNPILYNFCSYHMMFYFFFFIFKHIYSIISMLCWFLFCFVHWMFILRTRNNKVDCLHRQPSEIMEAERFNCLWVIYYVRAFNMNRLHNWIVDIEFWTFSFTLHSYIFRS